MVGPAGVEDTWGPTTHPFALASVTKLLTAYAVLVAAEEETVSLDQPAGPPGATIRHLLAHASGLGPEAADGVIAPVGQRRIYSNAGFERLAEEVQEAASMGFDRYLAEAVLAPLTMTATRLGDSPAHGATSTASDLACFAGELSRPTLLSRDTWTEATTVAFEGLSGVLPGFGRQDPNDWGLGVELRGHKHPHWTGSANSPATFGHFGRNGSFCWIDPRAAVGLVCLTDRPFGAWAVDAWPELSDAVLAARAG